MVSAKYWYNFISEPCAYIFSVYFRYIIEEKELEFYMKNLQKKMGKGVASWINLFAKLVALSFQNLMDPSVS
jgi:hypothetical protein